MTNTLLAGAAALALAVSPDSSARALLDSALAPMGGLSALQSIEQVRLEVMTEWQRTEFDANRTPIVLSYELSTELRDYTRPAWRYTRRFYSPNGPFQVIDIVTDSVAAVEMDGQWRPQNVAYVEERDEVFTFAPERIVRLVREAADSRALSDTVIGGVRYARVVATVGRFHPVLHFRRGDGILALATFRAAQPNDFGLAPWGAMEVAIWYSQWRKFGDAGLTLPTQLDVYRVGRPYKRMSIISAAMNPSIPADSFVVADSLRASFLATARKPMFDLPMDSARIVDGTFATFGAPGTPAGAVKIGGRWVLFEAGTAPLTIERSVAFLRRAEPNAALDGAVLTASIGMGGVAWLAEQAMPARVAGAAIPVVEGALRGWSPARTPPQPVNNDQWIRAGSDSLRIEIVDLPDYPRTAVVYVPSLRWAYAWIPGPVQQEFVIAHVRRRGWRVDRLGSLRNFVGKPLTAANGRGS